MTFASFAQSNFPRPKVKRVPSFAKLRTRKRRKTLSGFHIGDIVMTHDGEFTGNVERITRRYDADYCDNCLMVYSSCWNSNYGDTDMESCWIRAEDLILATEYRDAYDDEF